MQRFRRALRVFLLDRQVFEAVGADPRTTVDAVIIVTIVAFIGAIAAAITAVLVSVGFGLLNVPGDRFECCHHPAYQPVRYRPDFRQHLLIDEAKPRGEDRHPYSFPPQRGDL